MDESKCLILAVDDNKENLLVVSNFLKDKGYQIALSTDAVNAYKILKNNRVDLILLDVIMPGEDGYSFCRRIKQEEEFKDIPVIFLTARVNMEDLVEGFNAGGSDYITKPFCREELLVRVKNHIDLSIAKRNLVEQANMILQINRTRDRMYSIISHDIKAPFANICMMISMIREGYLETDSDDFRDILKNLNYSTKETYTLLENLLHWTRTQTGNIEPHPERISLTEIIESSLGSSAANAEQKSIEFRTDIVTDLFIYVDSNMIRSVLRNLVSNALKFSYSNSNINITAKKDDGSVLISITDYGVGMDQDQIDQLFRENVFTTTLGTVNERGSGLGLHIVKDFTNRNGGSISVKSTKGKGTTFLLSFPAV